MTADLAEEATTTTQASELLESETSARIRCEKELHELQVSIVLYGCGAESESLRAMVQRVRESESHGAESEGVSFYNSHDLRIVTRTLRCDHISEILVNLHWLRIEQRIVYKIPILDFKAFVDHSAPVYLSELLNKKSTYANTWSAN